MDARNAAELTQQEVADRLRKPQSYIAKVERNERRIDVVEFISLAKALGVDPARLFAAVLTGIDKLQR
ncbi:helix-turn-helix transcriptional regulator [Devosia sp. XK-2]|uniref:helix-turn-helix domain-containing protein n=1 Tax=Devosia sp. XK-2 TaxID=3126689 RepID=UPI0030D06395